MTTHHKRAHQRVTIKDVAQAAGVSVSTVSNALNGRHTAMTDETLARIQKAIATLKYRRSGLARSLVTHRTTTIGLLMAEIETPLFLQALHYIEPSARSNSYNVLLAVARDGEEERQALDFLLEKETDGFIFFSTSVIGDESHLEELSNSGLPVVLVNRAGQHPSCDRINWDNKGGVVSAMEHLVQLGHRRIALLNGPNDRRSTIERAAGYHQVVAKYGLHCDEQYVILADYTRSPDQWEMAARQLLDLVPRPTAVLASDDTVAATCIRMIYGAGLRVPDDMAVIGIDNQPFGSYMHPPLTTVNLPVVEAGKLAVEMLLERIAGERIAAKQVLLPCQLVVRESCGAQLVPQSVSA